MTTDASEMLLEIHAIQQLKYRYMRCVDTHNWELMAECLTEDATVWYSNGTYSFTGRDNILQFLRNVGDASFFSSHIAVHPEITLTGLDSATGVWRLQDIVYYVGANEHAAMTGGEKLEGAGYYHDEYRKVGGTWLIRNTGFIRIFESRLRPEYHGDEGLKTDPLLGMRPEA